MDENDPIILELDRLICMSRLREIESIVSVGIAKRLSGIVRTLESLTPGEYLLGTGPSTVGVIRLGLGEIVLGRAATVLEEPVHPAVDYVWADAPCFVPREVSRVHARLVGRMAASHVQYLVFDLHSTCGTFVNRQRVEPEGGGVVLSHGDVVSLGPSQMSTYVYYEAAAAPHESGLGGRGEAEFQLRAE